MLRKFVVIFIIDDGMQPFCEWYCFHRSIRQRHSGAWSLGNLDAPVVGLALLEWEPLGVILGGFLAPR